MKRVLAAELAVFVHFKSVGIVLFVFGSVVVPLFAFRACQNYFFLTHVGTSLIICLPFSPIRISISDRHSKGVLTRVKISNLPIFAQLNKAPLRKVEILYHKSKKIAIVQSPTLCFFYEFSGKIFQFLYFKNNWRLFQSFSTIKTVSETGRARETNSLSVPTNSGLGALHGILSIKSPFSPRRTTVVEPPPSRLRRFSIS